MKKKIEKLSLQEIKIIKLVAEGLNNKAIAKNMYLSEGTVKRYVSVILAKLQLENRQQLAVYAVTHQILT